MKKTVSIKLKEQLPKRPQGLPVENILRLGKSRLGYRYNPKTGYTSLRLFSKASSPLFGPVIHIPSSEITELIRTRNGAEIINLFARNDSLNLQERIRLINLMATTKIPSSNDKKEKFGFELDIDTIVLDWLAERKISLSEFNQLCKVIETPALALLRNLIEAKTPINNACANAVINYQDSASCEDYLYCLSNRVYSDSKPNLEALLILTRRGFYKRIPSDLQKTYKSIFHNEIIRLLKSTDLDPNLKLKYQEALLDIQGSEAELDDPLTLEAAQDLIAAGKFASAISAIGKRFHSDADWRQLDSYNAIERFLANPLKENPDEAYDLNALVRSFINLYRESSNGLINSSTQESSKRISLKSLDPRIKKCFEESILRLCQIGKVAWDVPFDSLEELKPEKIINKNPDDFHYKQLMDPNWLFFIKESQPVIKSLTSALTNYSGDKKDIYITLVNYKALRGLSLTEVDLKWIDDILITNPKALCKEVYEQLDHNNILLPKLKAAIKEIFLQYKASSDKDEKSKITEHRILLSTIILTLAHNRNEKANAYKREIDFLCLQNQRQIIPKDFASEEIKQLQTRDLCLQLIQKGNSSNLDKEDFDSLRNDEKSEALLKTACQIAISNSESRTTSPLDNLTLFYGVKDNLVQGLGLHAMKRRKTGLIPIELIKEIEKTNAFLFKKVLATVSHDDPIAFSLEVESATLNKNSLERFAELFITHCADLTKINWALVRKILDTMFKRNKLIDFAQAFTIDPENSNPNIFANLNRIIKYIAKQVEAGKLDAKSSSSYKGFYEILKNKLVNPELSTLGFGNPSSEELKTRLNELTDKEKFNLLSRLPEKYLHDLLDDDEFIAKFKIAVSRNYLITSSLMSKAFGKLDSCIKSENFETARKILNHINDIFQSFIICDQFPFLSNHILDKAASFKVLRKTIINKLEAGIKRCDNSRDRRSLENFKGRFYNHILAS